MRLMSRIWPRAAVLAVALGGVFAGGASAHDFDVARHV